MTEPTSACPPSACGSCSQACPSASQPPAPPPAEETEDQRLARRMGRIQNKILVMSGKGGVGKSTVATNLALSLLHAGKRVGLLDVDIHGPSIPGMLQLSGSLMQDKDGNLLPFNYSGLKVMSIGFLLPSRDDAVIWRGPMKMTLIRQFLQDVDWGDLDYLVIDLPPGTGDEPLSVCQLAAPVDGAVVVTTPQDVATADVRRSIRFCQKLNLPVLGVVENMSGFACPHCGEITHIFNQGGGEKMAADMNVPFLGRIPIDAGIGTSCDNGTPFVENPTSSESAQAFAQIATSVLSFPTQPNPQEKTQ